MEKLIYFFFIVLLHGCSGDKWNDCIQPHGKEKNEVRNHGSFHSLKVDGNFSVKLIQDSSYVVQVSAGENFINQIITKVENGVLILEEDITCKFVRKQDRVYTVTVHCADLQRIAHFSGKKLEGDLDSKRLEVDKWAGGGDIQLQLNCDSLFGRIHAGSGDFIFSGNSQFAYIYQRGYGFIRNQELHLTNAYIDKGGTGDCTLTVSDKSEIDFNSFGDLILNGSGEHVIIEKSGLGEIIVRP